VCAWAWGWTCKLNALILTVIKQAWPCPATASVREIVRGGAVADNATTAAPLDCTARSRFIVLQTARYTIIN